MLVLKHSYRRCVASLAAITCSLSAFPCVRNCRRWRRVRRCCSSCGLPTLCCPSEPVSLHPLLIPNWQPLEQPNEPDRYKLNRISLPEYSGVEAFKSGRSDFPADALEKVFAKGLTSYVSVRTEFAHDYSESYDVRTLAGLRRPSRRCTCASESTTLLNRKSWAPSRMVRTPPATGSDLT